MKWFNLAFTGGLCVLLVLGLMEMFAGAEPTWIETLCPQILLIITYAEKAWEDFR